MTLGKRSRLNEPVHEISNNVVCATSKASDQPAHTRVKDQRQIYLKSVLRLVIRTLLTVLIEGVHRRTLIANGVKMTSNNRTKL